PCQLASRTWNLSGQLMYRIGSWDKSCVIILLHLPVKCNSRRFSDAGIEVKHLAAHAVDLIGGEKQQEPDEVVERAVFQKHALLSGPLLFPGVVAVEIGDHKAGTDGVDA